jgi:hypothetical protein
MTPPMNDKVREVVSYRGGKAHLFANAPQELSAWRSARCGANVLHQAFFMKRVDVPTCLKCKKLFASLASAEGGSNG